MFTERITFLDHEVEIVRRARRKSLTLAMHPDRPLVVKSNLATTQNQILKFLMSQQVWIEKNLSKFEKIQSQFKIPTLQPGSIFPFLGEYKYLQITNSSLKKIHFKIEDGFLVCYLPKGTTPADHPEEILQQRLNSFYKKEAEAYLTERMNAWVELTKLKPAKLNFRAQRTRWGSCSSQKHICLNWKLICQTPALIDYVIVHELCHIEQMNHSDRFWSLVESFLPNYQEIERVLRDQERLGAFLS